MLCTAHIVNDANQSAIPAILPFLVGQHQLSLVAAASLVLAMNLSSSIVQPLFGHWSDRRSLLWVIPISMLVACGGTAALGWAHSYGGMFVAALISGLGIAAFHPESSRYANYCSRGERATGMSYFSLGGYGGFALGPIVMTPVLLAYGLHGTAILLIPGIVVAIALFAELQRFEGFRPAPRVAQGDAGTDRWRAFMRLAVVVSLRSTAFFGAVSFLPLLMVHALHAHKATANGVLTAMLLTGILGTLAGGRMADRYDRRSIIAFSIGGVVLCAAAIAAASSLLAPLWVLFVLAAALGLAISISSSVIVVVGQELLPNRIGIASGVTLGLAVSVGGIGAPIYGAIGERFGMPSIFTAIAIVAALSALGCFLLPRSAPQRESTFAEIAEAPV